MSWLVRGFRRALTFLGLLAGLTIILWTTATLRTGGKGIFFLDRSSKVQTGKPQGRIGILVGHLGSDSGAVCADGLREVDVNLDVGRLIKGNLEARGYRTDLLEEFDPALEGYSAQALVALHADSCVPDASGFKVAHATDSAIPEQEERLTECIYREYERATGLPRHTGSITPDMVWYHAFYEVKPETPAVIVELGFLHADRGVLLRHPERVAEGIVRGILCFLEPEF